VIYLIIVLVGLMCYLIGFRMGSRTAYLDVKEQMEKAFPILKEKDKS
jgi:hypothetical protein